MATSDEIKQILLEIMHCPEEISIDGAVEEIILFMKKKIMQLTIAVILLAAPTTAYSLENRTMDKSELAKECLDVGFMRGVVDAKMSIAQLNEAERPSYNLLVEKCNAMIQKHNQLMIILFSGNTTALDKLLLPMYNYV